MITGSTKTNQKIILRILRKMGILSHKLLQFFKRNAEAEIAIPLSSTTTQRLEHAFNWQLQRNQTGASGSQLSTEDRKIAAHIQETTQRENINNVTRTQAYWTVYLNHRELHWALLAHMVSRNGGWAMTDLRGDLLPCLLNKEQSTYLFAFLERSNALIFQDAFPQLLLYEESKKRNRNLFHLLPHMGVSAWMKPAWNDFWTYRDSAALTMALIVNEQNYIEKRIVQNAHYQQTVLHKPFFKTQGLLQLNQVGFPFYAVSDTSVPPRLAGLILESFTDLTERIEFGKSLYAILFGAPTVFQGALRFAETTPHTGSRSDYWPQLFTPIQTASPDQQVQERLDGCSLMQGAEAFYSPSLAQAWPNRPLEAVEQGDWFKNIQKPMRHMHHITAPELFDLTEEACLRLNKIEFAVLAAKKLRLG